MALFKKKKSFTNITENTTISSTALFTVKEAYKTVRTNLILNLDNKPCHIFTITSSIAHEGKSTTAINLSIALAQCDKKVLLIDCDLRRKTSSQYLNFSSTLGLTDIVRGKVKAENNINVTKYANLDFISAGGNVNNPAEILASRAMNNFLEGLKDKYDFIILDTPPINIVSDSLPLISKYDGVILVARQNVLTTREFKSLLSSLEMIQANILGIIYIGTDTVNPYHKYTSYTKQ